MIKLINTLGLFSIKASITALYRSKALWFLPLVMLVASTITVASATQVVDKEALQQMKFNVYLDKKEIGYHEVEITTTPTGERVNVEAKFDVKYLFIDVFKYLHKAQEVWTAKCLSSIVAETVENGDILFIRSNGTGENGSLTIENNEGSKELSGCIRSFAYWDVERLRTDYLLNTQTGGYVRAKLTLIGSSLIEIQGLLYPAEKYLLRAEEADIELWYDQSDQWLALKTKVKGGRILSYLRNNLGKSK
ncbi:MAG: hypothetical protein ACI9J2_001335 [Saprospiraceae bacterium]